jgi:hypothetical protein
MRRGEKIAARGAWGLIGWQRQAFAMRQNLQDDVD